jgi:hypothetical protein
MMSNRLTFCRLPGNMSGADSQSRLSSAASSPSDLGVSQLFLDSLPTLHRNPSSTGDIMPESSTIPISNETGFTGPHGLEGMPSGLNFSPAYDTFMLSQDLSSQLMHGFAPNLTTPHSHISAAPISAPVGMQNFTNDPGFYHAIVQVPQYAYPRELGIALDQRYTNLLEEGTEQDQWSESFRGGLNTYPGGG